LSKREVSVGETPVKLTATEYDLLKVLIHHAGRVRAHHELIHELWGRTRYQDAVHLLRVTLSHLRRNLGRLPGEIRRGGEGSMRRGVRRESSRRKSTPCKVCCI
jgi:two-component system KDP operon response regulator KdpE